MKDEPVCTKDEGVLSDDSTFGYVSVAALMALARNQNDRRIDCNDIARFPRAAVVKMPFKTDGIAMIYSDTFKVTNVEALKDQILKAVVFYVTQEESDRYDAEAEQIVNERQTL